MYSMICLYVFKGCDSYFEVTFEEKQHNSKLESQPLMMKDRQNVFKQSMII